MKKENLSSSRMLLIGCIVLITILLFNVFGGSTADKLIGTWVVPDSINQKLEIRTEELRFNYRRFDYKVKGSTLYLQETYPGKSISGKMPFKLKGDTLIIDLGEDFSGHFYGCDGTVKLKRK